MRIKNIAVVILSVCALITFAGCTGKSADNKPKVFSVEHFTHSKGLPCDEITCMAALGNKVWAGSEKGLFAYDGVNWEIHSKKNNNRLGSDIIVGLQTLNRCLYIATDNGACYYDGNDFRSVYTGGRARAVSGNGGEVAVGTAYGVIIGGKTYSNSSAGLVSDEITQLIYDKQGQLWVGTRAGISKLSGGMARNYTGPAKSVMGSSLIDIPANPSNCRLPGNFIKTMILYKDGLAIGSTEGLCITDMANNYEPYTAEHKEWMQVNGKIVDELVKGNSKIPGNKVNALATTDNYELLFAITNEGLGILKGNEWLDVDKLIPGLPKSGLTSVAWCGKDLWIGSDDGIFKVADLSSLLGSDDKN